MVIYYEVIDLLKLLDEYWELMSDDVSYRLKHVLGIRNLKIPKMELQNHVLFELKILFNKNCSSLSKYKLLIPTRLIFADLGNRLLGEELDYNTNDLYKNMLNCLAD